MTNPTPTPNKDAQSAEKQESLPGPLKSLIAAFISGGFAIALYFLTASIAQTFANKPVTSTNQTALRIAIAVRTLVVGMSTLATVVFGIITFGILILAISVSIQQLKNGKASPSDSP